MYGSPHSEQEVFDSKRLHPGGLCDTKSIELVLQGRNNAVFLGHCVLHARQR